MMFWIEFFKDKRFSLDFKIANFIMRDSLRNYLACDLAELNYIKNLNSGEQEKEKRTRNYANKIDNNIRKLMNSNFIDNKI